MCDARHAWRAAWVLLAGLLIWHAWTSGYNHDEIEHLHAAWLISDGQRPFVDFFEQHPPTLWVLFAPVAGAMRSPHGLVFLARLFDLCCLGALFGLVARLVRRLAGRPGGPWPLLLLFGSYIFMRNMIDVRPDPLMNVLLFAGLLLWLGYLERPALGRAALSGLCFGAAVAVLQKALVVLGLLGLAAGVAFVLHRERRGVLARGLAVLGVAAAGPVALLLLLVERAGWFREFWLFNVDFNRFFYLSAHVGAHFSIARTLLEVVGTNPVIVALGLAGLVRRKVWTARDEGAFTLAVVLVGYLLMLAASGFPLQQYFIVPIPLLGLFAADFFTAPSPKLRAGLRIATVGVAIVTVAALLEYESVAHHLSVQTAVLERTTPAETVFVPPQQNPIFRRDAGYFWYNAAMLAQVYRDFCAGHGCVSDKLALDDERWHKTPPALVWVSPNPDYLPYRWSERSHDYRPSAIPNLWVRVAR